MTAYPVHYRVERPAHFTRFQLGLRMVAFLVLGVAGLSFGTVFACLFLGLPMFAAVRLGANDAEGDAATYVRTDGPRIVAGLRWFAAICAWAGLIAEELPRDAPEETVRIDVDATSHATPGSALWRVVTGLPSALVLGLLCSIGVLVWLWAALSVLFVGRVGPHAFAYLAGLQRWSIRLLAYQAALVDEYPPFSFGDLVSPAPPVALAST